MNYAEIARDARKAVLFLIHKGQTSHISSNFSIIDIAAVLYENLKPEDEVVWSAGWKSATAYYFLARQGKISWDDVLEKFPRAPFLALIEPSTPGVHVLAGSMGHGLPIAVGMALARKKEKRAGRIFCIMSDGEMNEGTTWESAAIAAHHNLDNLTVIVDKNGQQALGSTEEVLNMEPLREKWRAFGWEALELYDGHEYSGIYYNLFEAPTHGKPLVTIMGTIKGKGVKRTEEEPLKYHYQHVDDAMLHEL